jgi:hypothetical protein
MKQRLMHILAILWLGLATVQTTKAQIIGIVVDTARAPLPMVQIFNRDGAKLGQTRLDGYFNLNLRTSRTILEFFLERWQEGMFVHFEMVPDRMPEALLELLSRFPPGGVQLEVGIQTFDDETAKNISRRQNYAKLEHNIRRVSRRRACARRVQSSRLPKEVHRAEAGVST